MKRQQTELLITGVAVVVLAFVVMNNVNTAKRRSRSTVVPSVAPVQPPSGPSGQSEGQEEIMPQAPSKEQQERSALDWGRDPFSLPALTTKETSRELRLQGISRRQGKGYAMINGEIVTSGNRIGEYEIKDVEKDRVLIRKGEQTYYLTFEEPR